MCIPFLHSQHARLATLAEQWLEAGAHTFSVWHNHQMLACWSAQAPLEPATLIAPIRIDGQVVATLQVGGLNSTHSQQRLEGDATLIAHILKLEQEVQQLSTELTNVQDQMVALCDLAQSTHSHLGVKTTLQTLTHEIARLVPTESVAIIFESQVTYHPETLIEPTVLLDYFRLVIATGRELIWQIEDGMSLPAGIHSLSLIPILVQGEIKAGLALINQRNAWKEHGKVKLLRAIAKQAGIQIEHARMYQDMLTQTRLQAEMDLARKVQLQLLPQTPPKIDGLDIAATAQPASLIGGDFYDFIVRLDRPTTFTVGDVAGKGMPAALIMGMLHSIIQRAARFMPSPTPAAIVQRANEDLYDDFTQLGTFATTFIGQYDTQIGMLHYANAGHAPVIFCPAGGKARLINADGPPIGVMPASSCIDHQLTFGPEDILVVATDGFSEAMNDTEEIFGNDRLLRLIEDSAGLSAPEIADHLSQTIAEFAMGRAQCDDQTLMVLKGVRHDH
ncbi:MAG: SpoIIE family protein phosphatase [Chloroflexi bacterium AL-W]|nr:SpoIIE family protein phosphatase [Chloroflexi bacterium AL-N1]NOK66049.1 SpoIIE family protein phosphatase [Chloroflexi bacterium AL-N10]NOK72930.1 SpoIIE family protein phosphatase [Chloroflexi bacterium AL-N5]NOK79827.1 SpoIIE family protein phosphatase [Chloroflexi bacterium AL-W]NOK88317.1 SpoIIE family protein phosphatase [Chloroflexi bacterium AL-N15]